ncbi:MAG: DUF1887 family CARF protein [Syntrophobacteraceae bacterium]|nr:DUF1887 family CARF protein [Syntrophobacteraceae bacterium]
MARCLVCLVSDQTIPNILVAADLKPDYLLLISTPGMEKKAKSGAILETLALHGADYSARHEVIEVAENSISDFRKKIGDWIEHTDLEWEYVVNLTCGTKLMSIAAYDFFKSNFGSEMVYVPIPKNEFVTPFPLRRQTASISLAERLSVEEYLAAYGFKVISKHNLDKHHRQAKAREETTSFIFDHYQDLFPLLRRFRELIHPIEKKLTSTKGYLLRAAHATDNGHQTKLLEQLGFEYSGTEVSKTIFKADWEYLRGGWLEEYLFLRIKEAAPSGMHADILLNVHCRDPQGNENEFDVVFTFENTLHIVECKSLEAAEGDEQRIGGTINDFLYKLGALRRHFGLTPKAFLATTSSDVLYGDGALKTKLVERGRQFSTEIIPLKIERDPTGYFKKMVFERATKPQEY